MPGTTSISANKTILNAISFARISSLCSARAEMGSTGVPTRWNALEPLGHMPRSDGLLRCTWERQNLEEIKRRVYFPSIHGGSVFGI